MTAPLSKDEIDKIEIEQRPCPACGTVGKIKLYPRHFDGWIASCLCGYLGPPGKSRKSL
jgi:hypothetical protein